MRTPSRNAFAVVAAAALIVVGVDYTTFATSGNSLLLGRSNDTSKATSIQRSNPGPALRLGTASSSDAPMVLNGEGKVVHLNADKVDGMDASQLGGHVISYIAGERFDVVDGMGVWSTPVKPGNYEVTFRAILFPAAELQEQAVVICGVVDTTRLGNNPHIYTAQTAFLTPEFPAAVSGTNAVVITKDAEPGVVCFSPNSDLTLFKPIAANFTKLSSRDKRAAEPIQIAGRSGRGLFAGSGR